MSYGGGFDEIEYSELKKRVFELEKKFKAFEANTSDKSKVLNLPCVAQRSEQLKGDYREHFIDWKNKYFEYKPKLYEYKTKANNERFTLDGLHKFYKKAMLQSPFNGG